MKMVVLFVVITILLNVLYLFSQENIVSSPWSEIPKTIYIQRGLITSAWDNRYTTFYHMIPVGDGTYVAKVELLTGNFYNFIFFASTNGVVYYDTVPSEGSDDAFFVSTFPVNTKNVINSEYKYLAYYGKINGDARRILVIPPHLQPGTTLYVYSNWASKPLPPQNFRARPGNKKVELSWDAPYGYWGAGGESFKSADVLYGGYYEILRSTAPEGDYVRISTVAGNVFTYTDYSVENGKRYYYVLVVHDAYKSFLELKSDESYTVQATPNEPTTIRFRVEGIDLKLLKKKFQNLVYLTPENVPNRYLTKYKIPGRFTMCFVRKRFLGIF